MSLRPEVQVQLDALAEMLHHWVPRVRHPAQFWPQFEVLAEEVLEQCAHTEKEQVRALMQTMLSGHGMELKPGFKHRRPPEA